MATLQAKISAAKQQGYSDDEIVKYVSSLPDYADKTKKAISAGYKPEEIVSYLSSQTDVSPSKKESKSEIPTRQQEAESKGGFGSAYEALSALPRFAGAEALIGLQKGAKTAGGALAGAATIPEKGLALGREAGVLPENISIGDINIPIGQRGATEEALRYFTGAAPGDVYFGAGKLGGEVAATAGAPAGLARGIQRAAPAISQVPAINRLLASVEGGGFGDVAGANVLQRMLGGGIAGGLQGALLGGTEGGAVGAGLGTALPLAAVPFRAGMQAAEKYLPQTANWAVKQFQTILNPEKAKLVEAAGSKIDNIISELGSQGAIVPGTQPHAGEVAVKAGSTGFSSLVKNALKDIKKVPEMGDILADRDATNMLARDLYNKGLFQSADQAERALIDIAGKPGTETKVAAGMGAKLKTEDEALTKEAQDIASAVAEPKQMQVGQKVKEERTNLIKNTIKQKINPLYEKAKAHPDAFDVTGVQQAANEVAAANTLFGKELDPVAARTLEKIQPKLVAKWKYDTEGNFVPDQFRSPSITMAEAVELNKALNRQLGKLIGSEAPGAAQTITGINQIKDALKESINANVPGEFATAFKDANEGWSKLIAKPFKETEFAKLDLTGTAGQALLKGSDVAGRILAKPEYAQQFVSQMKESPEGLKAAGEGIEGLFRDKAVVNGKIDPARAEAFLRDNKEALDVLKEGGLDVQSRLSGLLSQGKTADMAAELARKTRKPLEAFTSPEGLREGFRKNPDLIETAAKYLGDEERKGLSRGMLQDAFDNPANASKALQDNIIAIKKSLRLSNPDQAESLYQDAVRTANIYDSVLKNQKLIGDINPNISTTERLQKISELTKGLSPSQMRDINAIERDAMRSEEFERLAKGGAQKAENLTEEAIKNSNLNPPSMFLRIVTFAKDIVQKTAGKISEKKAIELAKTFLEPKLTQKALMDAKAWQTETLKKGLEAAELTKGALKTTGQIGRGASRLGIMGAANAMAPDNQNRNALAR